MNIVELIGHYGSDVTHACSAWSSTDRNLTPEKRARIPKMLADLASHGHHTPFEKSMLHFLVTTDIASHIHLLKHRIGVSINAESARYKEIKEDKYHLPDDWRVMASPAEQREWSGLTWMDILENYIQEGNRLYHQSLKELEPVIGRKRAKESSRYFRSYASGIQADISFNFRSFAHFQSLRNKPDAQKEIREIAQQMLEAVRNLPGFPFQHTLDAFGL